MRTPPLLALSLLPALAAPALAQLPAPVLISRTAPRAAWTAVTTAGTSSTTVNQRADNPGAASNDELYVFGGSKGNNTATTYNDLWAFDAAAGTFTQLIPNNDPGSPTHRGRAAIAWNFTTGKLMVFGGNTRNGGAGTGTPTLLNDLWEYDPVTNLWTDVTPAGTSPSPRQFAAMTWDPVNNGMVLFGGQVNDAAPNVYSNETWLYDSVMNAWTLAAPTMAPAPRAQHSLMTRPDFNDCLLCCGLDNASASPDQIRFLDVWTWNGSDWTKISDFDVLTMTGTSWPASANANQAVYDQTRQRVVLQGGQGITVAANVTYVYGPSHGGSPTNYTSEFDCLTNTWSIYANPTTGATPFNNNDPQIGRISRYWAGYVAATGKVYKACGQNAAGASSNPTYNVYQYQANPVASAVVDGAGCAGPGGVLTLTSNSEPWTGRTWTATCTNFGPFSLAVTLWGTATAPLPLNALLPVAPIGCDLLNTADLLLGPDLPVGGQLDVSLVVPDTASLAGSMASVQIAEFEFDLGFNWIGLYTSNGLTITIGAL